MLKFMTLHNLVIIGYLEDILRILVVLVSAKTKCLVHTVIHATGYFFVHLVALFVKFFCR